jgi:NADH dehydrogenase [ubiquinone] 1 alpha subcomplex assembly factor 7
MTPLATLLLQRIAQSGPITLADYMAECLLHPVHGYYTSRDPLGAAGDFTTAPEISQMFGELLGLALAQSWLDQGAPATFTLAELGPGRGTLMADVLRATRGVPGFHAAAQVTLLEASPTLRAVQRETLRQARVAWVDSIEALPDQPLFLLANEFFDALPVRQFARDASHWRERLIGARDGALRFGLSDPVDLATIGHRFAADPAGSVVEVCPLARLMIASISRRLVQQGGLALIVDYGNWRSKGDTLQALRAHRYADPLAEPGLADLTTHVDFEALALAAPGLAHGFASQGDFLRRLGIDMRAEKLGQSLQGSALEAHLAAHQRLTSPTEMGSLFKVLSLSRADLPPPPGVTPRNL